MGVDSNVLFLTWLLVMGVCSICENLSSHALAICALFYMYVILQKNFFKCFFLKKKQALSWITCISCSRKMAKLFWCTRGEYLINLLWYNLYLLFSFNSKLVFTGLKMNDFGTCILSCFFFCNSQQSASESTLLTNYCGVKGLFFWALSVIHVQKG